MDVPYLNVQAYGIESLEKLFHCNFAMHQAMMQTICNTIGSNEGDNQWKLSFGGALE